jgi:hypothetical protein
LDFCGKILVDNGSLHTPQLIWPDCVSHLTQLQLQKGITADDGVPYIIL